MTHIAVPQNRRWGRRPSGSGIRIARRTGPLHKLKGKKILVIADGENLRYGAQDLGYKLAFGALGSQLRSAAKSCELRSIYSRKPGDKRRAIYLKNCGWFAHPRDIEFVKGKKRANSDNSIIFKTALFVSRSSAEIIIIGSGDGNLVNDIAKEIVQLPKKREVFTMSLAGSTSYRLMASKHPVISHNIEIGRDCLLPLR